MRTITLWQPWAWLIFVILKYSNNGRAAKRVETRSWPTKIRGRIVIHAAKFKLLDSEIYEDICQELKASGEDSAATQLGYLARGIPGDKFGVVLGTVELAECVPIEALYGTEYDTPLERSLGDWSPGRYGWILKDPILFEKPIPAKGSQRFWKWVEE